ncbi:hypothetical protein BBAD15_g12562 [Beauveria bassiana D1-5]|uniref:Uncharacterized protein n=1 Tax=Beauveria bassiana D1-5 TaxID=1245745 RepID=A0A0A2VN27_BEABA|nr:hypothetical protein BBAD15_g12562 [Beauveria bassiana D1-5]
MADARLADGPRDPGHQQEQAEGDDHVVDLLAEHDPGPADVQRQADAAGAAGPAFLVDHQQPHHFQDGDGGQREERTAQPQRGIADDDGHDGRDGRARQHAEPRRDAEVLRQQGGGVAADAVEHRVAQRQLAGVAADDVPRHRQRGEDEQQDEQVGPERRARDDGHDEHDDQQNQADAGRTQDKDQEEDPEIDDLFEVGGDVVAGQRIDDADDHGPGHRAVQAAQAAQHHDHEGGQHEVRAHRREHRILRRQEARGDADEGGAQAEGDGVDVVDVHAHQRRGVAVLRHRPQRAAQVGAVHEQVQQHGQAQADHEGHQLAGDHGVVADVDGAGAQLHRGAEHVGAEDHQRQVQQDGGHAHRGEDLDVLVGVEQRLDDAFLRQRAQREQDDRHRHQADVRMHAELRRDQIDQVHADHQEFAVREVDDADHAEDQRQPQADDGVGAAQQQAIDDQLNEDIHGATSWNGVRPGAAAWPTEPGPAGPSETPDAPERPVCWLAVPGLPEGGPGVLFIEDGLAQREVVRRDGDQLAVLPLHHVEGRGVVLAILAEVEGPAVGGLAGGLLVRQHGRADLVLVGRLGVGDGFEEGLGADASRNLSRPGAPAGLMDDCGKSRSNTPFMSAPTALAVSASE